MTEPLWITRQQAAQICASEVQPEGISTAHFDSSIRPALRPVDRVAKRGKGGCKFRAAAVVVAWLKHRIENDCKPAIDPNIDPLLTGPPSDALERLRTAKAIEQEKKNSVADRILVPVAELQFPLTQLTTILREAISNVAKRHGNGVADLLNQAITQWEAGLEKMLAKAREQLEPTDAGASEARRIADPNASPANDASLR